VSGGRVAQRGAALASARRAREPALIATDTPREGCRGGPAIMRA